MALTGMATVPANKMAGLKSLLLRAWRERWSEMQWSVNIKKFLPLTPGGDNYALADLLLRQALVGSSPNSLLLSYLKHALSSQVVSYGAALRCVPHHKDISKPHCVRGLLDLLHNVTNRICSRGNAEDSLQLSKSLLGVLRWLLDICALCLQKLTEDKQAAELCLIIEKSCSLLEHLMEDKCTKALLYVGRLDEQDWLSEVEQLEASIRGMLASMSADTLNKDLADKLDRTVRGLECLKVLPHHPEPLLDVSYQPLNMSINALVTQEAVLNPTSDIAAFAQQVRVIEKTQGVDRPELYCQLFRTCLLGLIDAAGGQEEIKWSAFTFLRLPQVLVKLAPQGSPNRTADLEAALDKLLTFTPLLDLADTNYGNCDCMSYLLTELCSSKYSLLTEQQVFRFNQRRQAESQKPKQQEQSAGSQPNLSLILRAEPTVQSILKTLDADYSRNQEALLGVLCHMLSGKSFELILTAAASTGRLQSFAIKLIKFNEFAKQTSGEAGPASQTRALLFDITFLMLCHIMQLYGTDIITQSAEAGDSFFVQWALRCLPEDGKYKSLELLSPPDASKVEGLLRQFNPDGELRTNLTRWHEVCWSAPFAIQEVLFAYEQGAISGETVKNIVDNVKNKMCCLPVVVSAGLCSHINMIDDSIRQKPRTIIRQLMKTMPGEPTTQYYNERSHLMQTILHRMIKGILPTQHTPTPHSLPHNMPAYTMLMETFRAAFNKGHVDIKTIHRMDHLLSVGGPKWFCEHLVREVLSPDRLEDVTRGVSLLYALFHIDLENLTLCLIHNTLPGLLHSSGARLNLLTDPRGRCLAKLCVMCLMVIHHMRTLQKEVPATRKGRKRTRTEIELEDQGDDLEESRPAKMRRQDDVFNMSGEAFTSLGELIYSRDDQDARPSYDTKDPLSKALVNLFRMFQSIVSYHQMSQKLGFVMSFVEEAVKCEPSTAKFILQYMPISMVSQLMRCMPANFGPDLLLAVSDLSTTRARCTIASAICQNAKYEKEGERRNIKSTMHRPSMNI